MGKKLIITEKPSVARDYAAVLKANSKKNGYIENDEYIITWCFGHLVEMLYPEAYDPKYKKWNTEDLPFLPQKYIYGVVQSAKDQYAIVNSMLHRDDIDVVYWAGDSGKEGQTIEENIRSFGGVRAGMEERRVWVDSQTEEELLRGIREAKPMSEYASLGDSGVMRAIEDYALGINFSRALSVKYGGLLNRAAHTDSYKAIAVGRVMTCVLGMIVDREREIRNFSDTPFYRVVGFSKEHVPFEWRAVSGSKYFESPKLYKENGFKDNEDALRLIEFLKDKEGTVSFVEKKTTRKKAPALYNLAELQADCSKIFKITPSQTLDIVQELYERKLTTYPRTDARVLTTAVAKEITKNISGLRNYQPHSKFANRILDEKLYVGIEKSSYTDDSKVTDHYAIIPTGQTQGISSLNDIQKKVFNLISARFLAVFYPPAEYEQAKMTVNVESESLFGSAKILVKPGYMEVSGMPKAKENTSANSKDKEATENQEEEEEGTEDEKRLLLEMVETLKPGDSISLSQYEVKEGKTSPPKRYTSGTIILAMENAGNLIEDEELRAQIKTTGIGTAATRQGILEKLDTNQYICINKKTQVITPENFGEMIYEVVKMTAPTLLNPEMTASWEKGLEGITNKTVMFSDYKTKLEDFVRRGTLSIIEKDLSEEIKKNISSFIHKDAPMSRSIGVKCPDCGGDMVTTPFGYGCSNFKNETEPCKFAIGKICNVLLDEENVIELLNNGKTGTVRGFKGKTGKKFDAVLVLKKDENGKHRIEFDFESVEAKILKDVKCPVCGSDIEITYFGYRCLKNKSENPEEKCDFSIGKILGVKLTQDAFRELVSKGVTENIDGFKSKTGKKFSARLALDKEDSGKIKGVKFLFDSELKPKEESNLLCPKCSGKLMKDSKTYSCNCGFRLFYIVAQKELTEEEVGELLQKGRTSKKVTGLKSKSGNSFDTVLKYVDGKIDFDFEAKEIENEPKEENHNGTMQNQQSV